MRVVETATTERPANGMEHASLATITAAAMAILAVVLLGPLVWARTMNPSRSSKQRGGAQTCAPASRKDLRQNGDTSCGGGAGPRTSAGRRRVVLVSTFFLSSLSRADGAYYCNAGSSSWYLASSGGGYNWTSSGCLANPKNCGSDGSFYCRLCCPGLYGPSDDTCVLCPAGRCARRRFPFWFRTGTTLLGQLNVHALCVSAACVAAAGQART